jgi:hypothetical protein
MKNFLIQNLMQIVLFVNNENVMMAASLLFAKM